MDNKPNMRPEMRAGDPKAESPRDRAARRAAEIREHRGSMDDGPDDFYVNMSEKPDGWEYEWKTLTVAGAENPSYQVQLARAGWEPVPADRHPDMMPMSSKDTHITRKGMILMERPAELVEEARQIEKTRARKQVRAKEEQLTATAPGQFERNNKDQPLARVKKGWEAIPVPE